jgi:AcrR family transcriptional regulator
VIGKKGRAQTTLADIGEAAGYSRGLPAAIFGSKENLVFKAAETLITVPTVPGLSLFTVQTTKGVAGMLEAIESWFLVAQGHQEVLRGILVLWSEGLAGNAASRSPELYNLFQTFENSIRLRFQEFLAHARKSDELRPEIDIAAQSIHMVGAIVGILWQWMIAPDAFDLAGVGRSYTRELHRTLTGMA